MKVSINDVAPKIVGGNLSIRDLAVYPDANLDFSVAKLEGNHGMVINHVSDRIYYILSGEGKVFSDGRWDAVKEGDCVYIRKDTWHSIKGYLEYAVITSPPFDPDNEDVK